MLGPMDIVTRIVSGMEKGAIIPTEGAVQQDRILLEVNYLHALVNG